MSVLQVSIIWLLCLARCSSVLLPSFLAAPVSTALLQVSSTFDTGGGAVPPAPDPDDRMAAAVQALGVLQEDFSSNLANSSDNSTGSSNNRDRLPRPHVVHDAQQAESPTIAPGRTVAALDSRGELQEDASAAEPTALELATELEAVGVSSKGPVPMKLQLATALRQLAQLHKDLQRDTELSTGRDEEEQLDPTPSREASPTPVQLAAALEAAEGRHEGSMPLQLAAALRALTDLNQEMQQDLANVASDGDINLKMVGTDWAEAQPRRKALSLLQMSEVNSAHSFSSAHEELSRATQPPQGHPTYVAPFAVKLHGQGPIGNRGAASSANSTDPGAGSSPFGDIPFTNPFGGDGNPFTSDDNGDDSEQQGTDDGRRGRLSDGGSNQNEVKAFLTQLIAGATTVCGTAGVLDVIYYKEVTEFGRPRIWAATMVIFSYAILIPGLTMVLFCILIAIDVGSIKIVLTDPNLKFDTSSPGGPIAESVFGLLDILWDTGGETCAILMVIYAMVVPAIKLAALAAGEVFRYSDNKAKRFIGRVSIRTVQVISKWACPDMFAYIFVVYLFRDITNGIPLLIGRSHLDKGFCCFTVFCVLSTFSSLAFKLPDEIIEPGKDSMEVFGPGFGWLNSLLRLLSVVSPSRDHQLDLAGKYQWRLFIAFIISGACGVFTALFVAGLDKPMLTLKFTTKLFIQPTGPLPEVFTPAIEATGYLEALSSRVSVMECLHAYRRYADNGEATSDLGWILICVFALSLTVVDMFLLFVAAVSYATSRFRLAHQAMEVARLVGKFCMLDVMVVGVLVVNAAMVAYARQGFETGLGSGVWCLLGAEAAHYGAYFVVGYVVFADIKKEEPQDSSS